MKLRDLSFRDVFEKYLIFHCNWFLLTGGERDEWPWPEEADGVLVYGCDGIGDELSLVILCPVITEADTFLVDSSPEKVHANGFGLVGSVLENLLDVEVEIPDQDKMDRLGILSKTVHWRNKDRKRMLAATSIDPLRTFSNYDTFETLIRCGEHGIVAAQVKLEDYQDGVFIGSLLEMLDDDIDVYENDKIKVQVGFVNKELLPVLVGEKIAYEGI